jgi:hypothetical protein
MSSGPKVIAICGPKRHGKDTVANWFVKNYGYKKICFADGLKQTVAHALQVPLEYFYDDEIKESVHAPSGHTYRHWLQQIGTEAFRELWPDTWVNWWTMEARKYDRVVCADMRFLNEAEASLKVDPAALLIRVVDNRKEIDKTHRSESEQWDIDCKATLGNEGTLDELYAMCGQLAGLAGIV